MGLAAYTLLCVLLSAPLVANTQHDEQAGVPLTLRLKHVSHGSYCAQILDGQQILMDVTHVIEAHGEEVKILRHEHMTIADITHDFSAMYPCMSRAAPGVPSAPVTVCANIFLGVLAPPEAGSLFLRVSVVRNDAPTPVTYLHSLSPLLASLAAAPEGHYFDVLDGDIYNEVLAYVEHEQESCPEGCCTISAHL